jgi:serine/threonine protein kinase
MSDTSTSSKVSCTPAFQPPEALTWGFTEDPITSDVWALGVCLYCFVFGRLPFTGSCVLDITNSITNDVVRTHMWNFMYAVIASAQSFLLQVL